MIPKAKVVGREAGGDGKNRLGDDLTRNSSNPFWQWVAGTKKVTWGANGKRKEYAFRSRTGRKRAGKFGHEYERTRCHYCLAKTKDRAYIVCARYPACKCGFCSTCLKEIFRIDLYTLTEDWICLACCGACGCVRCRGRKEKPAAAKTGGWHPGLGTSGIFASYSEGLGVQIPGKVPGHYCGSDRNILEGCLKDAIKSHKEAVRQSSEVRIPNGLIPFLNPWIAPSVIYTPPTFPYFARTGAQTVFSVGEMGCRALLTSTGPDSRQFLAPPCACAPSTRCSGIGGAEKAGPHS